MDQDNKTAAAISELSQKELGDVKVLMIEDDAFFSELVLDKLSASGCIPYSSPDGREAFDLAERYQPDVIILDLMLPGMSGEEILVELKKREVLKNIPVIVFSNKSEESVIQYCLDNGAAEYLVKSGTDLNKLVEVVKRVVGSV